VACAVGLLNRKMNLELLYNPIFFAIFTSTFTRLCGTNAEACKRVHSSDLP
jgi:hypothetical protein